MESSYYADVHPDGKHIYIGSSTKSTKGANVGYMHVINIFNFFMCFCINNSNKAVFSVGDNSQTSL
jgi:hypothetical protein